MLGRSEAAKGRIKATVGSLNCGFGGHLLQLEVADCRLEVAECRLEVADCRLEVAECRLEVADCRLEVADCRLEVVDCWLEVADCQLEVVDCGLRLPTAAGGCRLLLVRLPTAILMQPFAAFMMA